MILLYPLWTLEAFLPETLIFSATVSVYEQSRQGVDHLLDHNCPMKLTPHEVQPAECRLMRDCPCLQLFFFKKEAQYHRRKFSPRPPREYKPPALGTPVTSFPLHTHAARCKCAPGEQDHSSRRDNTLGSHFWLIWTPNNWKQARTLIYSYRIYKLIAIILSVNKSQIPSNACAWKNF